MTILVGVPACGAEHRRLVALRGAIACRRGQTTPRASRQMGRPHPAARQAMQPATWSPQWLHPRHARLRPRPMPILPDGKRSAHSYHSPALALYMQRTMRGAPPHSIRRLVPSPPRTSDAPHATPAPRCLPKQGGQESYGGRGGGRRGRGRGRGYGQADGGWDGNDGQRRGRGGSNRGRGGRGEWGAQNNRGRGDNSAQRGRADADGAGWQGNDSAGASEYRRPPIVVGER